MLEALVFAVCISGGQGCAEATQSYYTYNVDLQKWAKEKQRVIENKVGKGNITLIGTGLGLVFVRKGSIPMGNNLHLVIGDETTLQWKLEY